MNADSIERSLKRTMGLLAPCVVCTTASMWREAA
jgi:hypothetical protein